MSRLSVENSEQPEMNLAEQSPITGSGPAAREGNDVPVPSLRSARAQVEITAILAALKHTGWNRKQAARLLSISYRGLLYKIRQHNIAPEQH
jgi:DNA-binding NtrC family response regulator